ncbi:MAG: putative RNA dependent RNA polymerase [Hameenlinna totivirus 1]|nr:MAG: putative RNA dependent RNA polymerase [Hameenlinna totivirus 1]
MVQGRSRECTNCACWRIAFPRQVEELAIAPRSTGIGSRSGKLIWARICGYACHGPQNKLTNVGRRHFTFSNNLLKCKRCHRIELNHKAMQDTANVDNLLVPVPVWMLIPHVCLLANLKVVEKYKKMKWIKPEVYDRWMELNGFDYQLGSSVTCMGLWRDLDSYLVEDNKRDKVVILPELTYNRVESVGCLTLTPCSKNKNSRHVHIDWGKIANKKDLQVLDEIWHFSSHADEKKTTISASQIIWHSRHLDSFRKRLDRILPVLGLGASNVTATAIAIHCLGNPSVDKLIDLIETKKICCLDSASYSDIFKLISVALRRSAHWPDGSRASLTEVAQCAGWELAIGRSGNVSNWDDEHRRRTKEKMYLKLGEEGERSKESNDRYLIRLKAALTDLIRPIVVGAHLKESFHDFVLNRQTWVSSGSTGGEKMQVEGEYIRINKHVYFETLTTKEMEAWLESEPKTDAVASEKFESGKARAIYGTKPIDYAISAFVLAEIEPRMNLIEGIEAGLTGIDVLSGLMHRKKTAQEIGTECSMIDYADFNYQHTLEAQALVFEVVAELFEHFGAHGDKVKAAKWTSDALMNQWCRFPLSAESEKITQGMFSGCRATNFLNTILNRAYFEVAVSWVRQYLKMLPDDLYHIHQGDDVWISNKSRLWAIVVFKTMQDMGFDFQAKKQMFDVCRAEFLRVLYSEEGCMGYLARAVATLIVKPIQGSDLGGPAERAQAMSSQINILYRRGFTMEGAAVMWDALVPYSARVMFPRGGFSIPVNVLKLHPKNGGLGLLRPGEYSVSEDTIKPMPTYKASSKVLERVVPKHMSEDWIKFVSQAVARPFDSEALIELAHASNVTDSLRDKDRMVSLMDLEVKLREWKAKQTWPVVHSGAFFMDKFFENTSSFPELERMLALCSNSMLGKRNEKVSGAIRSINLAITMSPFKNLTAAAVSLKGDWVDIARTCIGMCSHMRLAAEALEAFNCFLMNVGAPVTGLLMDGMNVGVNIFEFKWHPILLSWVNEFARERSAIVVMERRIRDVPVAKVVLQEGFDNAIRVLSKFDQMSEISKY